MNLKARLGVALASATAVVGLFAAVPAHAANADFVFVSQQSGFGALAYNSSTQLFYTSTSTEEIFPTNPVNNQWEEIHLSDGDCLSYYYSGSLGSNVVTQHSCNGATYVEWGIEEVGNDGTITTVSSEWEEDQGNLTCAGGWYHSITSHGNGKTVNVNCPNSGTGKYGANQGWNVDLYNM